MHNFDFFSVPRIVFGRGRFAEIGTFAAALGRTAAVVANGGRPGVGGTVDRLAGLFDASGVRMVFRRQRGEPTVADVEAHLSAARDAGCDLVVGLGGGSAIDAAKAVAGLLTNPGSPMDYMEVVGAGRRLVRPAAPWIAVPTTAGTGAEVTRNAVIGSMEHSFKASIRSELLLARVVLVDPELGVDVSPVVTARAGMDALCQLIESSTSVNANPVSDALAIQGIRLAGRSLKRAVNDGTDLDAREDMALAALLSGITLTNVGLGTVHGLAAPLGANFPIPHGTICAALLPQVISANVQALRALSPQSPVLARYAEIGRTLVGKPNLPNGEAVDAAIDVTISLVRDLAIPPLGQLGLGEVDVPEMVRLARQSSSMKYNPVTLTDQALADALRRAM